MSTKERLVDLDAAQRAGLDWVEGLERGISGRSPEEFRLECLKLACGGDESKEETVARARLYFAFVVGRDDEGVRPDNPI